MSLEFRLFRVSRKLVESDIITSFFLQPTDGAPVWDFKPGQYLTLQVPTKEGTVLKTYSVSSGASSTEFHRITVKRETGVDGAPDGVGSSWLHDQIEVGDEIQIAAPRGVFFLNETSSRPVLLLSGGVGLTPLVSMLHRLEQSGRDVYFIHACENGQVHALREEVLSLGSDRIRVHTVYRQPSAADREKNWFDAEGMIDRGFLQRCVPIGDYEAYLCGPTPFMRAMYQLLLELGVPRNQIAFEFFGKASSLEKDPAMTDTSIPTQSAPRQAEYRAPATLASLAFLTNPNAWAADDAYDPKPVTVERNERDTNDARDANQPAEHVTFRQSNKTALWDGSIDSLLELAENAGLEPEFSCRAGICNTCICRLLEGEIEYFEEPLERPDEGEVLICCARPKGSVVLDI